MTTKTAGETNKPRVRKEGAYFGLPLPFWVIAFLVSGLALGFFFPEQPVVKLLYASGTIFPKIIVTLGALLIFNLLAGATARLVLVHKDKAGRLFGLIFGIYVAMGVGSLVLAALLIPVLTGIPLTRDGASMPGLAGWLAQVGHTFSNVLAEQPLLQALLAAVIAGYITARVKLLHPAAHGFIVVGDLIIRGFKLMLWYYPVMIGCLAIGIPMNFGSKGMAVYGQTVAWVALITFIWMAVMVVVTKLFTKRTMRQLFSYWGTVWPTGFGTGGSHATLPVNIVSAEHDLGLRRQIAELAIIFGTVLNKNCSTAAVLLVTASVASLLDLPISQLDILMLVPAVLILGLESPGVPGGAAFFMSPIVGVMLGVPDLNLFVTTFITVYSGLIPMFAAAGNTTSDGIVGAILNDRFGAHLGPNGVKKEVAGVA